MTATDAAEHDERAPRRNDGAEGNGRGGSGGRGRDGRDDGRGNEKPPPKDLEELLDRCREAAEKNDPVSLDAVLDLVGRRSFGPLLLVAGVVASAPVVGDIPGVPTATGIVDVLLAGQLLVGRDQFWLPRWLLRRTVKRERVCKAIGWMQPVARFVDRLLKQRLEAFTGAAATRAIAIVCIAIALATPFMEVVPLSANVAGAALTMFGLSLIANDGLMALLAFLCTTALIALLAYGLLT